MSEFEISRFYYSFKYKLVLLYSTMGEELVFLWNVTNLTKEGQINLLLSQQREVKLTLLFNTIWSNPIYVTQLIWVKSDIFADISLCYMTYPSWLMRWKTKILGYHSAGNIQKSNRKIVETKTISIPFAHIYMTALSSEFFNKTVTG